MSGGNLRVLVIGAGSIGMRHARILDTLADVETRLCPIRSERVPELRAMGLPAFPLEGELDSVPDAVVVATDTLRHVEDILPWAAKDCWVLAEKPLSVDLASTLPLGEFEKLRVACCLRAHDAIQWAAGVLGKLGTLHSARVICQSFLPEWRPHRDYTKSYCADTTQGGVLRDLVHEIDYAQWLLGMPSRVACRFQPGTPLGIKTEAGADLVWTYASGLVLTMRLDYLTRQPRRGFWVDGDLGSLEVDLIGGTGTLSIAGTSPVRFQSGQALDEIYSLQLKAFLSLVRGGADPLSLPDLAEGRRVMGLVDTARRSAWMRGLEERVDLP